MLGLPGGFEVIAPGTGSTAEPLMIENSEPGNLDNVQRDKLRVKPDFPVVPEGVR